MLFCLLSSEQQEILGHYERDRDDLNQQTLPAEGTRVLVLYRNKSSFILL